MSPVSEANVGPDMLLLPWHDSNNVAQVCRVSNIEIAPRSLHVF